MYLHSVLCYGHALFLDVLRLEKFHLDLEAAVPKRIQSNVHVSAVYHLLLQDWYPALKMADAIKVER